jgi:tetratricopeptide (TPR) repeat protein
MKDQSEGNEAARQALSLRDLVALIRPMSSDRVANPNEAWRDIDASSPSELPGIWFAEPARVPRRLVCLRRFEPERVSPWRANGGPLPPVAALVRAEYLHDLEERTDHAFQDLPPRKNVPLPEKVLSTREGEMSPKFEVLYETSGERAWAGDDLEEAERLFTLALEAAQGIDDRDAVARVGGMLARVLLSLGRVEQARLYIVRSILFDIQLGSHERLATHYAVLAEVVRERGELDESYDLLQAAVAIAEADDNAEQIAALYNNLSEVARQAGRLGQAETWLQRAVVLAKEIMDMKVLGIAYANLAELERVRGRFVSAKDWLMRAIRVDRVTGDPTLAALDYDKLADLHELLDETEEAEVDLAFASGLARHSPHRYVRDRIDAHLAALQEKQGQLDGATSIDRAWDRDRVWDCGPYGCQQRSHLGAPWKGAGDGGKATG